MSPKLKNLVYNRANGLCEYCKSPANISSQPFVVEHIFPISKGGETFETNLALSCQGCNNHKYNKIEGLDFLTNEIVMLFNPRLDFWLNHFSWSDDTLEIIGISSVGRATIDTLKLNRQELQNLRDLLLFAGKHPPL
jgi:hypothetical protein